LSGGIDSSLVLALARRAHVGELTCYSVAFGPEHANELAWSGLVAAHCGVRQVVVEISAADVAAELDHTVAALSQPNGDPLTVPNTLLFRRAAERAGRAWSTSSWPSTSRSRARITSCPRSIT
jgi:asparagine synthase (glutamine-hydrolysing)